MSTKTRRIVIITFISLMAVSLGIMVCGFIYASFLPDFYCNAVYRVAARNDVAYLLTIDLESNYRIFKSEDMGTTWYLVKSVPEQVQNDLRYPIPEPVPLEICDPTRLNQCYRISTSSTDLEYSQDNGKSWKQVTIPFRLKWKRSCNDPKPTSLVFVTNSSQSKLIVGMGTAGVIMRSVDGSWSYRRIDELIYNIQE